MHSIRLLAHSDRHSRYDRSLLALHQVHIVDCHWLYHTPYSHRFGNQSLSTPLSVGVSDSVSYGVGIGILSRRRILQVTDQRVKTMSEIVQSMRIIKMYCWEAVFERKIRSIRK